MAVGVCVLLCVCLCLVVVALDVHFQYRCGTLELREKVLGANFHFGITQKSAGARSAATFSKCIASKYQGLPCKCVTRMRGKGATKCVCARGHWVVLTSGISEYKNILK